MITTSFTIEERLAIKRIAEIQLASLLRLAGSSEYSYLNPEILLDEINKWESILKDPGRVFSFPDLEDDVALFYLISSYLPEINSNKLSESLLKKLAYAMDYYKITQNGKLN